MLVIRHGMIVFLSSARYTFMRHRLLIVRKFFLRVRVIRIMADLPKGADRKL